MSTETDRPDELDALDGLGRELGEAIAGSAVYEEFEEAKAAVEADDRLQERIEAFEERRQAFALARESGEATREDLQELQQAQRDLHADPLMAEYLEAKGRLQDRLAEVNRAISEPLAVDFGGEAGGCCRD
ncbi:MAG: YlbF family regulator [Haloferacaceae archaeon]